MDLNNWSKAEVDRAESSWGQKIHPYSKKMFDFLIKDCKSWLDLGCGFGRFLNYLINSVDDLDVNYIGYDSSQDMLDRIRQRFPDFAHRTFLHNITDPIVNKQEAILCSAVLIHITLADQNKVLNNILAAKPKKIAFDINSPDEKYISEVGDHFERKIKCSEGLFRMTWQSHYAMTKKVQDMFKNYNYTIDFFNLQQNRHKVIYLLEKKS